jgi:hypothetical protein
LLNTLNSKTDPFAGSKVVTSRLFYDISETVDVNVSLPGNWWKSVKTQFPTCDSICGGSCNQVADIHHPEAPLQCTSNMEFIYNISTPTDQPSGMPSSAPSIKASGNGRLLAVLQDPFVQVLSSSCILLADYYTNWFGYLDTLPRYAGTSIAWTSYSLLPAMQFQRFCNVTGSSNGFFSVSFRQQSMSVSLATAMNALDPSMYVNFSVSRVGQGTLYLDPIHNVVNSAGWTAPVITASYSQSALQDCYDCGLKGLPAYTAMFTLSPYVSGGVNGQFFGGSILGGNVSVLMCV